MPSTKSVRRTKKRILKALGFPFSMVASGFAELWANVRDLGLVLVPDFVPVRRNRDFEKSGRERLWRPRRRVDESGFQKGERERFREHVAAERKKLRLARGRSEEAVRFQEEVKQRKLEVSRGDAVNHLAKVNAKLRKMNARNEETDG